MRTGNKENILNQAGAGSVRNSSHNFQQGDAPSQGWIPSSVKWEGWNESCQAPQIVMLIALWTTGTKSIYNLEAAHMDFH